MTNSPAPGLDLSLDWCPINAERSTPTRALVCRDGAKRVGTISLGLRNVDDDYPRVDFDGVKVNDEPVYRDGAVSLSLIRAVRIEYPNAAIVGGPVSNDDAPGPRFRLRAWDEAGVQVHDPQCSRTEPCDCMDRLRPEVLRRLEEWRDMKGGISEEQFLEKRRALGLDQDLSVP
jgi:hypothetical protein